MLVKSSDNLGDLAFLDNLGLGALHLLPAQRDHRVACTMTHAVVMLSRKIWLQFLSKIPLQRFLYKPTGKGPKMVELMLCSEMANPV